MGRRYFGSIFSVNLVSELQHLQAGLVFLPGFFSTFKFPFLISLVGASWFVLLSREGLYRKRRL